MSSMGWLLRVVFFLGAISSLAFSARGVQPRESIWSRPLGRNVSFAEAQAYCGTLQRTDSDYDAWSLPSSQELTQLEATYDSSSPSMDNFFWSASPGTQGNLIFSPTLKMTLETSAPSFQTDAICIAHLIKRVPPKRETPVLYLKFASGLHGDSQITACLESAIAAFARHSEGAPWTADCEIKWFNDLRCTTKGLDKAHVWDVILPIFQETNCKLMKVFTGGSVVY